MKSYYFIVRSEYIYLLKLHGIERDVFAVIDSCYRTGSRWKGSTESLAYIVGSCTRSIERSLSSLIDANLVKMLSDHSYIPSASALSILDSNDKMSEASDKMSRQIVEKTQKKETIDNIIVEKKPSISNSSNSDLSDEEFVNWVKENTAKWKL